MKPPRPEDYATEEEFLQAMNAYEAALYWAEERAVEEYYEKKNKSTFMSDAKTEADWRAEKRGVRKEMLEAFKDPKLKA